MLNRHLLFLVIGVVACSTSVIWIKLSHTDPLLLAGYRCILAAVFMLPLFLRAIRGHTQAELAGFLKRTWLPGVILAIHFISWILGARRTDSANATLIVNFVPMVMPFVLWILIQEKINRQELTGTAVAGVGVLVLGIADYEFHPENFTGDMICFISMWLYAFYLGCGRMNRDLPSIWIYVVPVYFIAGVTSLILGLATGSRIVMPDSQEWIWILGLALFPTVVGHSLINYSMKFFRGQLVGLFNVGQFISAGLMAYLFLQEIPVMAFYPAAGLVLLGAWIVVRGIGRETEKQ